MKKKIFLLFVFFSKLVFADFSIGGKAGLGLHTGATHFDNDHYSIAAELGYTILGLSLSADYEKKFFSQLTDSAEYTLYGLVGRYEFPVLPFNIGVFIGRSDLNFIKNTVPQNTKDWSYGFGAGYLLPLIPWIDLVPEFWFHSLPEKSQLEAPKTSFEFSLLVRYVFQ